ARRPCISAGLQNVGRPGPGIEAPRASCELRTESRKPAAQQQLEMPVFQVQARSGKTSECPRNPLPRRLPLRPCARQTAQLPFDALEERIELRLPHRLLGGRESSLESGQAVRALAPKRDRLFEQLGHFRSKVNRRRAPRLSKETTQC